MHLRRLNYFLRISELGSLNRASEALRIAQPALSRQMRMLEEELSTVLFERTPRGMKLTEEGERLRSEIVGPLRQLDFAFANAGLSGNQIAGSVAIGMPPSVRKVLAKPLVNRILSEEPGIIARIVEGEVDHLAEWLLQGELDCAVICGPTPDERIVDRPLLVEELFLVGPQNSELDPGMAIKFDQLPKFPLLLPHARYGLIPIIEKLSYINNIKLDVAHRVNSLELIKDMIGDGLGYSILPLSAITMESRQGKLRHGPIIDPELTQ